MEFSRVGKHTIKCILSEEEIFDMGFTVEDLLSNSLRTQEFMNRIFDRAEKEFQVKFDSGIKTVRADFLPDHRLSLTFSEQAALGGGILEHLKDIVNGMLSSIPQEKWEEIKRKKEELDGAAAAAAAESEPEAEAGTICVLLKFSNMDTVIRFSKQVTVKDIPENALYKYNNEYYVFVDLSSCVQEDVFKLSMITDEYVDEILAGPQRKAFMDEHGEIILKEKAIETLKKMGT